MTDSSQHKARYSRQVAIPGIGPDGQRRIRGATVLIVGIGALGTHSAGTLARAGIGELWLCDRDIVEWSNLQRQVLFTEADAEQGLPKAVAAANALAGINRDVVLRPFVAHCSAAFLDELPRRPDLVLDGTDNFPTRYILNDWCRKHRVPWIYAGAVGCEGAAMVVREGGPCLRCLWPQPPAGTDVASCETAGVLAPVIAAVAAFQTAEALKLLAGSKQITTGVYTADVWRGSYAVLAMAAQPAPECFVCRSEAWPALAGGQPSAVTLCGRDAVQIDLPQRAQLDLDALAARLRPLVLQLDRTPHLLRFEADGCRFSIFPGGRALLFGVQDPLRARALYDRWVGAS